MSELTTAPLGIVEDVLRCGDVFAAAAELGLDGVEVVLAPGDLERKERLESIQEAIARSKLRVPSLILASHNVDGGIADADACIADRARAEVVAAVEWARTLRAEVVLVPFFLAADVRNGPAVERCRVAFAALCPVAAEAGATLCFEGSLPADTIVSIAERVDSDAFGCHFDPANLVVAGLDPASEARALGPLIRRVHLKDTQERRGDCRLGDGHVDFDACARALAEIGYEGWFVLESPPGDARHVARDVRFARAAFDVLRR